MLKLRQRSAICLSESIPGLVWAVLGIRDWIWRFWRKGAPIRRPLTYPTRWLQPNLWNNLLGSTIRYLNPFFEVGMLAISIPTGSNGFVVGMGRNKPLCVCALFFTFVNMSHCLTYSLYIENNANHFFSTAYNRSVDRWAAVAWPWYCWRILLRMVADTSSSFLSIFNLYSTPLSTTKSSTISLRIVLTLLY